LRAYPLFDAASPRLFGGAEVRAKFFAAELQRRTGFDVTFLVAGEGQPATQIIDNIAVVVDPTKPWLSERFFEEAYAGYLAACEPLATFPYFRIRSWRSALLWQIPVLAFHRTFYRRWVSRAAYRPRQLAFYARHAADAYCLFHIDEITADIIATCRRPGGPKTLLFLIHDIDVAPEPAEDRERLTPRTFALRNADLIIAQTQFQADRLRENFERTALVIRNPMTLEPLEAPQRERDIALWIGRAQPLTSFHKRPELLFDLARLCPEVKFLAILNPDDPVCFEQLMQTRPDNVAVIKKVPFAEVDVIFQRARVFVSTSGSEGFPNTFLQAGKHAVPIVSLTVDPEGMLSRHQGGSACGGDLKAMAAALRSLWSDPAANREQGLNARAYVERFHDIQRSGDLLAAALRDPGQLETRP
jgi:glycosyltransferase involved in cell wall biosynthesis